MRFVTGRAAESPVVNPDFKSGFLGNFNHILHDAAVSVPVCVRKHVNHKIHVVVCHVTHICLSMVEHTIAVVCGACE